MTIMRALAVGVVVLGLTISLSAQTTQPAKAAAKPVTDGVQTFAQFAPADAMLFVERIGHDAIRDVFDVTNLGAMAHDEVMEPFILQFLQPRVVEAFAQALFGGSFLFRPADEESAKTLALTKQLLTPLWTKPSAMFLLPLPNRSDGPPKLGLICAIPSAERKEIQTALDALMPKVIDSRSERPLNWSTGKLTWSVVTPGRETSEELPSEGNEIMAALSNPDGAMFMICWTDELLLAATSLEAAVELEKGLASPGGRSRLAMNDEFKTVMAKTDTANWAMRAYVNLASLGELANRHSPDMAQTLTTFGLENVRALGCTLGYENKITVYRTYVLSPDTHRGLLRLFASGGSCKPALAMMPHNFAFAMAGQVGPQDLTELIRDVIGKTSRRGLDEKMPETAVEVLKQVDAIAAGSDGRAGVFMGTINLITMQREQALPLGLVVGMKDKQAATDGLASLRAMAAEFGDEDPDRQRASRVYRQVTIVPLGNNHAAAMDDRIIVGMNPQAVRLAIDAAKAADKGMFVAGSAGATILAQAGDGAGVFVVDVAGLARSLWPMIAMFFGREQTDEWSIPDTNTLLQFLGPEVVVYENDDTGLRMTGAGLLPFYALLLQLYGGAAVMHGM